MERITRAMVQEMFERVACAMNRSTVAHTRHKDGSYSANAGALTLDYAACYGGYVVEEMSETGGESRFFGNGCGRKNAREMYNALYMVLSALEIVDRDAFNERMRVYYTSKRKAS